MTKYVSIKIYTNIHICVYSTYVCNVHACVCCCWPKWMLNFLGKKWTPNTTTDMLNNPLLTHRTTWHAAIGCATSPSPGPSARFPESQIPRSGMKIHDHTLLLHPQTLTSRPQGHVAYRCLAVNHKLVPAPTPP